MTQRYYVHVYHVVRSKFAVTADNQDAAMRVADELMGDAPSAHLHIPGLVSATTFSADIEDKVGDGFLYAEDAEEVTGYLVDEIGDEEYEKSQFYDPAREVLQT